VTRATIDTNIFKPQASTPPVAIVSDPNNAFITQTIANLNEHAAALDTIGAPSTGTPVEIITSGAATLTTLFTQLSTTGTKAYSLADGTVTGQEHIFEEITAASTPIGTLTVATMDTAGGGVNATFVFNAKGQRLHLQWTGSAWHIVRLTPAGRTTVVVGTTTTTGMVMNRAWDLSVTGTVHGTLTHALPNGRFPGQQLHIDVTTAAILPVGDLAGAYKTAAGAAATSYANITDTTTTLDLFWDGGAAWQAVVFTAGSGTATLS